VVDGETEAAVVVLEPAGLELPGDPELAVDELETGALDWEELKEVGVELPAELDVLERVVPGVEVGLEDPEGVVELEGVELVELAELGVVELVALDVVVELVELSVVVELVELSVVVLLVELGDVMLLVVVVDVLVDKVEVQVLVGLLDELVDDVVVLLRVVI
jgi:hypothetical protein